MSNIFILAIKFDCLFLAVFQSYCLIVSFIIDKLLPPAEHTYQKMLWIPFESISVQKKDSLRSAKNVVFFLFCILVDRPMGRL